MFEIVATDRLHSNNPIVEAPLSPALSPDVEREKCWVY
jgi:hypothetical protein